MILVDTSIWLLTFKKVDPIDLTKILHLEDVVTCLPIIQEVLQGFRDEQAYRLAYEAMWAFPRVDDPLSRERFETAVRLYRTARKNGITIRSSVDCLIASCAITHDLCVYHSDRDFEALEKVSTLRQKNINILNAVII